MSKIISAIIALAIVTAATAPSYAFDSKTFWQTHEHDNA
jgi:hypothetical protein